MNQAVKETIKAKTKQTANDVKKAVKEGQKKVEEKLEINNGMSPGQKAGKVAEKVVDKIEEGLGLLGEKFNEWQGKKYATLKDLRVKESDKIIGEGRNGVVTQTRAEACKEFVQHIKKQKIQEVKQDMIDDAVVNACVSYTELKNHYLNTEAPKTKAEIEYMKKKLTEVEKHAKNKN